MGCYFMRQNFAVLNQNTSSSIPLKNYGSVPAVRKLNSKIPKFLLCPLDPGDMSYFCAIFSKLTLLSSSLSLTNMS